MKPSVSLRNFVGGVLGGSVGILMAWYLRPLFLPLGVLFGVVLGWWHRELISVFAVGIEARRMLRHDLKRPADSLIARLGQALHAPSWLIRFVQWLLSAPVALPGRIMNRSRRFRRWLGEHPANVMHFVRMIALIVVPLVTGAITYALCELAGIKVAIVLALVGIILGLCGMVGANAASTPSEQMRAYYREWEILSRYGAIGHFFYVAGAALRCTIGIALFVAVTVGWGFPLLMFTILSLLLVAPAVGMAKALCVIAKHGGHWLCFVVTLAATVTSWFVFRHRLGSDLVVWTLALATGSASGALTEIIRRPIVAFSGTRAGAWLKMLKVLGDFDDRHLGYVEFSLLHIAGFSLQRTRLARTFRAICFGTPVARPVTIV